VLLVPPLAGRPVATVGLAAESAGKALADGVGMRNSCRGWTRARAESSFSSRSLGTVTLYFLAMLVRVSPFLTVWN